MYILKVDSETIKKSIKVIREWKNIWFINL
jgi:hypothetical protein